MFQRLWFLPLMVVLLVSGALGCKSKAPATPASASPAAETAADRGQAAPAPEAAGGDALAKPAFAPGSPDAPPPTTDRELVTRARELGLLRVKIKTDPARWREHMQEFGITPDDFEQELYRISADPAAAEAYAVGY